MTVCGGSDPQERRREPELVDQHLPAAHEAVAALLGHRIMRGKEMLIDQLRLATAFLGI